MISLQASFFTSVPAGGFSLDSDLLQVFSGLKDSAEYSSRLQQSCNLSGLYFSTDFHFHQSLQAIFSHQL